MNIVRFIPKIALAASVSLAMAFTLSCSSDNDDGGGGDSNKPIVYNESYTLKDVTESSFTYEIIDEEYRCQENGVLETRVEKWDDKIYYSINGNTLSWDTYWSYHENATLDFTGTSSNLYGTWTRTKNKNADCEIRTDEYDGDQWYSCKDGWYFTKAVFKENPNIVELTEEYCTTDYMVEGSERRGYKYRNFNCNSYELYKGNSVMTLKFTESGYTVTYNGRSCTYDRSYSKRVKACQDAWNKHVAEDKAYNYWYEDYYYDFLNDDYNKCEQNLLPEDFLNYYNEKVSTKILPKKDPLFNAKRSR